MILNRLEIEGYGPFLKKAQVDFSNLNFFCIQGENGSGKSTLIDGIHFGLWGESNKARVLADLLPENVEKTRVFLDFDMEGRNIRIERLKMGSRSNQVLEIREEGREKRVLTKAKEILTYVEEELGLKKSFLSRAFLIHQGRFEDILESGKKADREMVLEIVLGPLFQKIKERIGDQLKKLEIHKAGLEATIREFDEKEVDCELEKLEEVLKKSKEKLEKALAAKQEGEKQKEACYQDFLQYENFLKQKAELKELETQIENRKKQKSKLEQMEKALELLPNFKKITEWKEKTEQREKTRREKEEALKSLEEDLEKEKKVHQKIKAEWEDKKEKEKAFYQKIYRQCIEVDHKRQEWKKWNEKKKEKEKEQKEQNDKLEKFQKQAQELEKTIKELEEKEKNMAYSEERLSLLKKHLEDFLDYRQMLIKRKERQNKLDLSMEQFRKREEKIEEEEKKREEIEKQESRWAWSVRQLMALEIRRGMEPGDACPVCGEIFSGREMESGEGGDLSLAQKEWDRLLKEKEAVQNRVNLLKAENQSLKNQIEGMKGEAEREEKLILEQEALFQQSFGRADIDIKSVLEKEEEKKELARKLQEEKQGYQKEQETLQEKIREKEKSRAELINEKENLEKELEALRKQGEEAVGRIRDYLAKMGLEPSRANEALSQIEEFRSGLEKLELEIQEREKELQQRFLKQQELRTVLQNLESELKRERGELEKEEAFFKRKMAQLGLDEEKLREAEKIPREEWNREQEENQRFFSSWETLKEKVEKQESQAIRWEKQAQALGEWKRKILLLEEQIKEETIVKAKTEERIRTLKDGRERYRKISEEMETVGKETRIYRELENDFKSNRFPAFYAKMILEQIIEEANRSFLAQVLHGRYALEMDKEKDCFLVRDFFMNRSRSVETLSGGEKFLASFALALSFSRMMGEKIGIFFIDEGFGTLDENNRNILKAIFDVLGAEKNRKIGLITHIPEIAEEIPQKILVRKTLQGSEVEVQI